MNMIQDIWAWLSRLGHCKGFGIQSPWAFSMACDVINTHSLDSLFADIESQIKGKESRKTVSLCRMTVKLARHYGRKEVAVGSAATPYMEDYLRLAGIKTRRELPAEMAVVAMEEADSSMLNRFADGAGRQSVMVVGGIHSSRKNHEKWEKLQADERTGITFDVYYCGVVFFDHKIYKQHYKIEF